MSTYITHDFKTPRPDGSRRLPRSFMLVPVLFYLSVAGGAYFGITSYMSYSDSITQRDTFKSKTAELEGQHAKVTGEITTINKEKQKAEKLASWVEGTRMMQPVSVAISRAIPPEVSLGEMSFERSVDIPAQVNLSIRINNGSMEEVGKIQTSIQTMKYRAYNSQQVKNGDFLDYKTILVWQQN
jgi:hypothetical protein